MIELFKESGALLEGHFLLSSGKHSNRYVQCARLLQYPDKAEKVVAKIVEKVKNLDVDLIVGPAMGGIVVAYELGRQLGKPSIFTEREDNIMTLRRGFEVKEGQKILISEDVVTTGKSSLETLKVLESDGAKVVGLACLVDRTGNDDGYILREDGEKLPIYSAMKLHIDTYESDNCPLCKNGSKPVKPGSRKM